MRPGPILLTAAFLAAHVVSAHAGGSAKGVVELFTSQGCSDCPPADKVLGQLANDGGVITLAWHVDYWDYLGWKDSFSSKAATSRQRAYNASIGEGVYTPQFVVNGTRASNSPAVLSGLNGLPVKLNVSKTGGKLKVEAGSGSGSAKLYLISYTNSASVAIQRGENAGRKIVYRHAVSGITSIGSWQGEAVSLDIARRSGGCAVILQRPGTGAIIGAAMCG